MLQIRLSKVSSGDAGSGGGPAGAGRPAAAAETVTVACPDHLVLADLPVAKSVGAVTSSASAAVRSVGRRSRRPLGERVHFCVRCDFPIAIYGRLIPCEHVFCLACARSDASCYLCDERIQKIQTIKLMEGIFICAAPHCLKSFLKRSEFESHIHEVHADLLQPNAVEKEGVSGIDARASSTDLHKQSLLQETSTARAPPRSGFSPSSNSQLQDREETRTRRHHSRDQPPPKLPLQPKQPSFQTRHQLQPGELQTENNPPQGFDRLQNWTNQQQNFENLRGPYQRRDSDQTPLDKPGGISQESSFANYPPFQVAQPPNYPLPSNASQAPIAPTSFGYATFPLEGSQPYYNVPYEMPRPELVPASAPEHASVLGFPPTIGIANFAGTFPRPWGVGLMGMPFEPSLVVGHGIPEGYVNPADSQGRATSSQGSYGQVSEGMPPNAPQLGKGPELQGSSADHNDSKGVLAPLPQPMSLPLPPPPPPLFPPISQQLNPGNYTTLSNINQESQGYGWQNDKHGFGNS